MTRRQRTVRRLMVLTGGLAACVAIIAVMLVWRDASRQRLLTEARSEGLIAYEQGRYDDALSHLSYYIANNRTDAEVLQSFADARTKVPVENNRHLQEAARIYGVVIDLQPDNIHAHLQLMNLQERLSRRLEWLEAAERVLALDPHNIDALRAQASAYYFNSQFDEAETVCARLIALDPEEVTWRVFYLQILQDRGQPIETVIETCRAWSESHATDGRYHLLLAQIHSAIGQFDAARGEAIAAAQLGADNALVLEHLVTLLDMLVLRDHADALIASTKQKYPREQWAYEASVRRYWKAGEYQRALEEITLVANEHDRLGGGLLRWKNLLQTVAGDDDPIKALTEADIHGLQPGVAGERDADLAWAKATIAKAHLQAANVREAIQMYREALALEPNDPVLHFLTGEAYAHAGEYHLAATALERAVQSDPGWTTAQSLYAKILLRLERYEAAARLAAGLIQRNDDPELDTCTLLARAWMNARLTAEEIGLRDAASGEYLSLTDFLERLARIAPNHAEVVELLALAYLRDGQRDEATSLIDSTLQSSELTSELLLTMTLVSETHDLRLETRILQAGIEQMGDSDELAILRARQLHRSGEVQAAIALLDQLPVSIGQSAKARSAYIAWASHPEAVAALHEVLDDAEHDIGEVAFVLAQTPTWHDADLAQRAIKMLEQIVGPDAPRLAMAKATYALQFEATNPASIAQAMLLTNRVLQATPQSLNALRLMAMLYMANSPPDIDGAITELTKAIQYHPRRVDLYPRIIRLLQRRGDHTTADRYLAEMGRLVSNDQAIAHAELLLLETQGDLEGIIARLSNLSGVFDTIAQQLALAVTWSRTGNTGQAMVMLEQLLATEPDNPSVLAVAAEFYVNRGDVDRGLQLLRDYEAQVETGVSALLLGQLAQEVGAVEEAGKWLRLAYERSPERLEVVHELGTHHLAQGQYAEARAIAEAGLRTDPEDPGLITTFVTASIHLGGRERREALRMLDATNCNVESLVDTLQLYDRVVAASDRGDYSDFLLHDLRELVQQFPESEEAWRLAITTHVHAGQLEQAADLARFATTRLPATAEFAELATQVLIMRNQLREALNMAMTWRQRSLHRPLAADAVIAALQLDLNQPQVAANRLNNHLDRILKERGEAPERLALLLRAFAADRRFDQLAEIMSTLLHDDDRWPAVLMEMAEHVPREDAEYLQQLAQTPSRGLTQSQ